MEAPSIDEAELLYKYFEENISSLSFEDGSMDPNSPLQVAANGYLSSIYLKHGQLDIKGFAVGNLFIQNESSVTIKGVFIGDIIIAPGGKLEIEPDSYFYGDIFGDGKLSVESTYIETES